jgi:hypothetical protein
MSWYPVGILVRAYPLPETIYETIDVLVLLTMDRGLIGDELGSKRDPLPERGLAHGDDKIGVAEKDTDRKRARCLIFQRGASHWTRGGRGRGR